MDEDNQDFMKMMEQASALSQIMGMEPGKTEQLFQMMQLAQLFGHSKNPEAQTETAQEPETAKSDTRPKSDPKADPASSTEPDKSAAYYDDPIHTPGLRAMKAALPYVDIRHQRGIGIWIKLLEIQKLMEMYAEMTATAMYRDTGGDWRHGMLSSIRPHMSEENQNMIDFLTKLIDMKEILTKMEGYRNGGYKWI